MFKNSKGIKMNLIWRFFWVMIFSRFGKTLVRLDESTIFFRVLPTDIDFLLHMNNGRYFSLLDLARIDFCIRNRTLPILRKNKIYAVAASEMIRFKKSLNLFQRFKIVTRLIGWDNKFFYFTHYFKRNNDLYALCLVKGCFLHKEKGTLNPNDVIKLTGHTESSPVLPDWVKHWQQADREFNNETMRTS